MVLILIIDDDRVILMVLQKLLNEQGYRVISARDGQEGIDLAKQHHPDLIICDWLMPTVDGLEVCRQVKSEPSLCTVFFILLTSLANVANRVKGLDAGADDFLTKPIEASELQARVRAGLRLHDLNQDLQKQKLLLQQQKQILETELAETAGYVRSLLPPPLQSSVDINSQFIPSLQLGGDCYGYSWLNNDNLALYLLDVSGHGVGAALLSISVLNLLRSQSLTEVDFQDPSAVLAALNQKFPMQQQSGMYFTIWYGVYNQNNRILTYASAGHPPALLVSDRSPVNLWQLETLNIPIGFFPDGEYTNSSCEVLKGSELYLFSDGIYEFRTKDGDILGLQKLIDILQLEMERATVLVDLRLDLRKLIGKLHQLSQQSQFEDDVSLLQVLFK